MPFTLSHAGFVLPLKGILSAQVLCGLMIGSIVPDFGYFIRKFGVASFAHSIAGAFCVSLPIGLAVYMLVHRLFVRIADTLPRPHSSFLRSWGIDRRGSKRNLSGIALAILLGAFSHNFVDSFAHEAGAAVVMLPLLGKVAIMLGGEPLHVFRILQYLGSFVGMAMIVVSYWLSLRHHCRARGYRIWQDLRRWMVLLGLVIVTMLFAAGLNAEFIPNEVDPHAFRVFGFKFLITWIPLAGIAFLCCGIIHPVKPISEQDITPNA